MLTKVGKSLASKNGAYPSATSNDPSGYYSSGLKASIAAKDYTGATCYIPVVTRQAGFNYSNSPLSNSFYGVKFGSGNSAESEDSYTLDNIITSNITVSGSPSTLGATYAEYDENTNASDFYVLFTITNNGSDSITIGEIGIYATFDSATEIGATPSTSSSNKKCCLIDRTILDAPLTLAPNDSAVLKYSFAAPIIAA